MERETQSIPEVIMGIQILNVPQIKKQTGAGPLTLPAGFNHELHAAKWVKNGPDVLASKEREHIIGTENVTADGWQVWKDGANAVTGKPYTVHLAKGEHILLFRSRAVQDAANAIYGNIGKERMMTERRGETAGGIPVNAPGILGDSLLSRVIGHDSNTEDGGDVTLNKVPDVKRIEPEVPEVSEPS
jgi:hypothetical protein